MKTHLKQRLAGLLASGAGLVLAGCVNTWDPYNYGEDNAFLEGQRPRYGHGGTQSPAADAQGATANARGRYTQPNASGRSNSSAWNGGGTRYLGDERKPATSQKREVKPQPRNEEKPPRKEEPPKKKKEPVQEPREFVTQPDPPKKKEPKPKPPAEPKVPYGTPVPGKSGYVYSPFDSQKRLVDVTDIPPGTEVKCPYTNKIFRVP